MEISLNQLPVGVVLIDEGGTITSINTWAGDQLGYIPGELQGQPLSQILTLASRMLYQTHVYPLVMLNGRVDEVVLILLTRMGQRIPVLFNASRLLEPGLIYGVYLPLGQRHHYEAELIQARQRAEAAQFALQQREAQYRALAAELEVRVEQRTRELQAANAEMLTANQDLTRANENLERFTYIASHDLQEPLRKIQLFSTLLSDRHGRELGESGLKLLGRMNQAGAHMSALIRDLLRYSRIAPRQQHFGAVSLTTVVSNVLDVLADSINQRGAEVRVDELPVVNGNGTQLSQLLQQLVVNALTFTPVDRPARIQVSYRLIEHHELPVGLRPTRPANEFHQISVRDEGMGFDEKYLDRIFQLFQRLHGRNEFPGTGVGLAICQRVVDNHGGAITATSQPGQGATFSIYLPC